MAEAIASESTDVEAQTEAIARSYFGAVGARDVEAMIEHWVPGGSGRFSGDRELTVPDGYRREFGQIFAAFPDFDFQVTDLYVHGEQATVRWRARGTFSGSSFDGIEPNGARIDVEGVDLVTVRDGEVVDLDAFVNFADFARQIGVLPPAGSPTEQRMTSIMNARTRLGRRIAADPEHVADGVWRIAGGAPVRFINAYLIEGEDGVTVFDAGTKQMGPAISLAAAALGPISRVVVGNAHADHRGGAAALHVPVLCHERDRPDVEGDGGTHYFDYAKLGFPPARFLVPRIMASWDCGPLEVAGTLAEGDEVAGFRVVELPGHSPGTIGLWRERDRLALTNDCFAMFDVYTGRPAPPAIPHTAFNFSTEQCRESARKLAALEPATCWPGHHGPLTGDVRGTLERIAAE
jgi:glyoxylase-like metal-dependent hydrolase (beta-lactamase superfamily II)/predicted ester cyclase